MSKKRTTNNLENIISSEIVKFVQDYKGWSLKKIGEVLDCSESLICHIKNKSRRFTLCKLLQLQTEIDMPLPEILLRSIQEKSIPEELTSHYLKLQKVLHASAQVSCDLDEIIRTEES